MQESRDKRICLLEDPRVIIVPQDPGEPPSWAPFLPGHQIFWANRDVFDNLKAKLHKKPCDICPDEIKEKCDREAKAKQMKIGREEEKKKRGEKDGRTNSKPNGEMVL